MSKGLYPRLAAQNIRKNGKLYLPYIISAATTAAMLYIMCAIYKNPSIKEMPGASDMLLAIGFGVGVIAFFSFVFLLYTNSFLMKRRKKELGLYSVLGMEKGHIARILLFEALYAYLISIGAGIAFGIIFDKLATLTLSKILRFDIILGFSVSPYAIALTAGIFGIIFLISLLSNIWRVARLNATELLQGGNVGEKEPKVKIILAVLGVLCLAVGYAISIIVESPLEALQLFFIAVILVIIGTYLLFTAVSIAVLKAMKAKKSFYYKSKNFTSVSGMLYRMKQNAVGLANICILSTMVLVSVSTTVSLYAGVEEMLNSRYPADVIINTDGILDEPELYDFVDDCLKETAEKNNFSLSDIKSVVFRDLLVVYEDGEYLADITKIEDDSNVRLAVVITAEDYNKLSGEAVSLNANETLLCSTVATGDSITLMGKEYTVMGGMSDFPNMGGLYGTLLMSTDYMVVADDAVLDEISREAVKLDGQTKSPEGLTFINLDGSDEKKIKNYSALKAGLIQQLQASEYETYFTIESKQESKADFYSIYGSFLFLGIMLGFLFLLVTIMIIYYKQISEGYDDRERFQIMQKVGMSHREVKKTIHSQILAVFFLPLVTACVHLAFAFPIINRLLALFQLTNIWVFAVSLAVTVAVYAVIYTAVYLATAKAYYRIVS